MGCPLSYAHLINNPFLLFLYQMLIVIFLVGNCLDWQPENNLNGLDHKKDIISCRKNFGQKVRNN